MWYNNDEVKKMETDFGNTVLIKNVKTTAIESNYLIEAIKHYTPEMLDLLYLCLSATRPQLTNSIYYDESRQTKFIPDNIIKEELNKKRISEKSFKMTCKKLAETVVNLNYVDGWGYRSVFLRIDYHRGAGLIFAWHPDIEPYILRMEKNYTEVVCKLIYKMGRDKWAKRVIEQVSRWADKYPKGREYKYDELRNLMGLTDKEFVGERGKQNFFTKLKKAAETITNNTPYKVSVTTAKKDFSHPRNVTHYFIHWDITAPIKDTIDVDMQAKELTKLIHTTHPATEQEKKDVLEVPSALSSASATTEQKRKYTNEELDAIERLEKVGKIDRIKARNLVIAHGAALCREKLESVRKSQTTNDVAALTCWLIEHDVKDDDLDQQLAERDAQKAAAQSQQQSMPVVDVAAQAATQAKKTIPPFVQDWFDVKLHSCGRKN